MRFTLDPGGDVEVPDGLSLGRCRPELVRLTGSADLADATLRVDGRVLADDHPAGTPPWVHGSCLTTVDAPDPVALAHAAPWHVAVLSGPDAGRLAVPAHDGTVVVGRSTAAVGGDRDDGRGRLSLHDATVSRAHLRISHRTRRSGGREVWRVQDLGSANGTTLVRSTRSGERRRGLGRRARRLRPGEPVRVGGTTLVVGPAADPGEPETATPSRSPVQVSTWLVPAVASLALAAMTRNPIFLLLGLGGPLGLALPELLRARRVRRRAARRGSPLDLGSGPAAASLQLATLGAQRGPVAGHPPAHPTDEPSGRPPAWWPLADEGLVLLGPRQALLAAARGLLGGGLLDPDLRLTVLTPSGAEPEWAWCRWLDLRLLASWSVPAPDGPGPGRRLVVADGLDWWRSDLTRWWSTRPGGAGLLLLLDEDEQPPAWCRHVLRLDDSGRVSGQMLSGQMLSGQVVSGGAVSGEALSGELAPPRDAGRPAVTVPAAPGWWIEQHARRITALDHAVRRSPDSGPDRVVSTGALPTRVALADLDLPHDVDGLLRRWQTQDETPGLVTAIGVGRGAAPDRDAGAAVRVDLLAEGPHALVAGTTGAGKSELLQSLLLGLALRYPPTRLAMVLVDYKGGTSFGRCEDLPHVVGQVTDLDQTEAARALDGLRAEMRRRERLFAEHGVGDLETFRRRHGATAPPRLLVVVDEFRALTEDLPEFVPGLVRLAAQGRSLGIHLVLATQRPAGAVSAQMRANVGLRLCLRVTDAADSVDVVEVPDAAALPVDRPGRALLRRGPAQPEVVQTAWAALPPGAWRPAAAQVDPALVGWAPGRDWAPLPPGGTAPVAGNGDEDHSAVLVRLARQAAAAAGMAAPAPVWLPPLPTMLNLADCADEDLPDRLTLGLVDRPAEQGRVPLTWHPGTGPLVVGGRSGSGRTTALRTVAASALARGWHVHLVGGGTLLGEVTHPGLGTVVGPDDPRRLARLLSLLADPGTGASRLLVVDDWGAVSAALERLPRGLGTGLLKPLLRDGRHHGLAVAVAGTPADLTRLLPHAGERLVLAVTDPHEDALLGVPRALATARPTPGRGIHLSAAGAVRCQVALAGDVPRPPTATPTERPPRLLALPLAVDRAIAVDRATMDRRVTMDRQVTKDDQVPVADGPGSEHTTVVLGRGGDAAGKISVMTGRGVLVVGPAGSGRSTTLATVTLGLRALGQHVVVVARAGPLAQVAATEPARHARTVDQARRLLAGPGLPGYVVVDDLDALARTAPDLDDLLGGWSAAAETGESGVPRVLASARTDRAAAAYRGALAALRGTGAVVVLAPITAGSADVAGTDLALWVDPVRPLHPGRGVLVHRGRPTCVQVAG